MGRSTELKACIAGVALCAAQSLGAQALTRRVTLDSLQLSMLSIDYGGIRPSQTESARILGLAADYGRLSSTLRLRLEASYWESRLTDDVVRTFADSLRRIIVDPANDDLVVPSRVSLYDVTMGAGVRWMPRQATVIQPFVGAGLGVHVINAEGPIIDGTFVERLFDNISTGLFAESGVVFKPLPRFAVDGRVRGDLVNGFRALSLRAGGVYYFGPLRRTDP